VRIGITGAQSVGKTTLLNALRSEDFFNKYTICDEVTREIKQMGFDINEAGSDLTQILIMQKHITNIFMYEDMLTDRTSLDGLVYTTYLYFKGRVKVSTLDKAYEIYKKTIEHYDYLFYIPPEFDLVDDGVRSTDTSFRDGIVEIFEDYLEKCPRKVIHITGSVRERLNQVMKTIGVE
jgi:nicotinamide riboside kinase